MMNLRYLSPIFVVGALACTPVEDPEGIQIGLLLPFTGDTAANGSNLERSVLWIVDEINDQGGLDGQPLTLVTQDTHGDVERTLGEVERMIDRGVVAIIGPESAELALAVRPVLEQAQVVFLSPFVSSGTQPTIDPERPWFRTGPSAEIIAKAMARDLLDREVRKVAILYELDDYDQALAEQLAETLRREGGEPASSIPLPPNQPSYEEQLEALERIDFDAVALIASPKGGAQVVNELQFLHGSGLELMFGPALETEVFVQNTNATFLESARGVAPAISADDDSAFDAAFSARFAEQPSTGAHFYFDATAILTLGLALAHHEDPALSYPALCAKIREVSKRDGLRVEWDGIAEALTLVGQGEPIFYTGLTGTMIMGATGQRLQAGTVIWTVKGGEVSPL